MYKVMDCADVNNVCMLVAIVPAMSAQHHRHPIQTSTAGERLY